MHIIWDKEAVDRIKNSHTVLELETFDTEKGEFTAYCVVPAEKIIQDLSQLDRLKEFHDAFLKANKEKNYKLCEDIAEHLIGRFGGELDSFYQEILSRSK